MTPPSRAADTQSAAATDRRAAWLGGCLLLALAAFYLLRGMPWANEDDLFFLGVGIDLAHTGQLANHTLNGWLAEFGTDKFYVHMPFWAYAVGGWVLVCGASTASFLVFQWLWYGVASVGLVRLARRFGLALGMGWLLAGVYLTWMLRNGFRLDAQAYGLMLLGLSFVGSGASFARQLAALLLLGFSLLTYPLTLALAVPFGLGLVSLPRPAGLTAREAVRAWLPPCALAAGVTAVAFLLMIRFDLAAFWSAFSAHRHSRVHPIGSVGEFVGRLTAYQEGWLTLPMYVLLAGCLGFVVVRWKRVEPAVRALVAACAATAVGSIALYPARGPFLVPLLSVVAGCALASMAGCRRWRWPAVIALAALYAWSQSLWLVNAALRRFPAAATLRAARETALRSGKEIVVDGSTARYVFDFQLPARTRDYVFFRAHQRERPMTLADKHDEDCWVVSAAFLDEYSGGLPAVYRNYPRITVAGHAFHSLALCPDEPVIVP